MHKFLVDAIVSIKNGNDLSLQYLSQILAGGSYKGTISDKSLWDIILENWYLRDSKGEGWSLVFLSQNITWDIIKDHWNLRDYEGEGWSLLLLSQNPSITWHIVKKNCYLRDFEGKGWSLWWLSQNPGIAWDIIWENWYLKDKYGDGWSLWEISKNPNITWDIVKEHFHLQDFRGNGWSFDHLSWLPCITWDIVKEDPLFVQDAWNLRALKDTVYKANHPFLTSDIYKRKLTQTFTRQIEAELLAVTWNPSRKDYIGWCFDIQDQNFIGK